MKKEIKKGEIIIYQTADKKINLDVTFDQETVWLTQDQMAKLFGTQRPAITKHLRNIFSSGELDEKSNVPKWNVANSDKPVKFYNLDVIISVGYRVNSKRATQFRVWATNTLKNYLIRGYAINEKRLLSAQEKFKELQTAVDFLHQKIGYELLAGQEKEILHLLSDYSKTLTLLEQYDKDNVVVSKHGKAKFKLEYEAVRNVISEIKKELAIKGEASEFFGTENSEKFKGWVLSRHTDYIPKGELMTL